MFHPTILFRIIPSKSESHGTDQEFEQFSALLNNKTEIPELFDSL